MLLIGWTFALITLVLAGTNQISWLDFLYYCSYIKLAVTLTKYVPQVGFDIIHTSHTGDTLISTESYLQLFHSCFFLVRIRGIRIKGSGLVGLGHC